MKFISYKCEFVGKINEIHILINKKSNRKLHFQYIHTPTTFSIRTYSNYIFNTYPI